MRQRQAEWLARVTKETWFASAEHKVLFCHIPLWWTTEEQRGAWTFSKVCRDAWLEALRASGVKLVVSGHTHDHKWLPAGEARPISQLIGGGPKPTAATIIEGHATRKSLSLTMRSLDGKILQTVEL